MTDQPTRVTQKQLAKALKLSKGYVAKLAQEGMPNSSVAAAEAWRAERAAGRSKPAPIPAARPANIEGLTDNSLGGALEQHRRLVQRARDVYLAAIEEGNNNQARLQTAYNQSLKTLIALEAEEVRRALEARTYIKLSEAEAVISDWTAKVVSRLDKLPLDCAEACNGDRPETAIKVLEKWAREIREELGR
jgi:transcriptional regulator with XRE-family HTH domain